MKKIFCAVVSFLLVAATAFAITGEELARRQARSVHLSYDPTVRNAASATASCVVTETQTNSYFMILGWDCGYCGVQDSSHFGRILIFSVWDPGNPFDFHADPTRVAQEMRAQVVYAAPEVNVSRFGGEGTGARTITPFAWQVGEPISVRIDATDAPTNRTAFTCFVRKGADTEWRKIATLSTLKHPDRAQGLNFVHSFVEDFWRNGVSAGLSRGAEFYDVATRGPMDSDWTYATKAWFSGDDTPSQAVDGGRLGPQRFFLKTGGDVTNSTVKVFNVIQ